MSTINTDSVLNTLFLYCGALLILPLATYFATVKYAVPQSDSATTIAGITAAFVANAVLVRYCYVAAKADVAEEADEKKEQ